MYIVNKHMKTQSMLLVIRETQIKTISNFITFLNILEWQKIKSLTRTATVKDVEELELSIPTGECKIVQIFWKIIT